MSRDREATAAAERASVAANPARALAVLLEAAEDARAYHQGAERRLDALAAAVRAQSELQGDLAAQVIIMDRGLGFVRDVVVGVVGQLDPVRHDIEKLRAEAAERERRAAEKQAQLERSITKVRRSAATMLAGSTSTHGGPIPIETARQSRPGLDTLAGDLDTEQRNALTPEAARLLIDAKMAAERVRELEGQVRTMTEGATWWKRNAVLVVAGLMCTVVGTVVGGAAVATYSQWLNRPPPAAETRGTTK